MGYRSLGIHLNQLLGVRTTYSRSAAYMLNNLLFSIRDLLWVIFLPWVHSHLRIWILRQYGLEILGYPFKSTSRGLFFFSKKKVDPHIVKICGGKCVVGSHQCFLININYHKILQEYFWADPHIVKICGSKYVVDLDPTLKCQIISIYCPSSPS